MDTTSSFHHCDDFAPTGASGTQSQPIERSPSSATPHATRSREKSWRVISSDPELKTPTQETAQAHDFTEVEILEVNEPSLDAQVKKPGRRQRATSKEILLPTGIVKVRAFKELRKQSDGRVYGVSKKAIVHHHQEQVKSQFKSIIPVTDPYYKRPYRRLSDQRKKKKKDDRGSNLPNANSEPVPYSGVALPSKPAFDASEPIPSLPIFLPIGMTSSTPGGAFAPTFASSPGIPIYPDLAPTAFELPPLYQTSQYCGRPCINQGVPPFYAPCDTRIHEIPVISQRNYAATLPSYYGMNVGSRGSSWTVWSGNDLDNPVFTFPESIL